MNLEIEIGGELESLAGDAVIVGMFDGGSWGPGGEWLEAASPAIGSYLEATGFTGSLGSTTTLPAPEGTDFAAVIVVGLGDELDAEGLRVVGGRVAKEASNYPVVATALHFVELEQAAEFLAFGFAAGLYQFDLFKSEAKPARIERLVLAGDGGGGQAAVDKGTALAAGVALTRHLVNTPAAAKPPVALAERVIGVAADRSIDVRVYDEDEIVAERFGGLAAVAAGAANPPRMVVADYVPADPVAKLTLVGKGIVFDSGGLSIKPASGMETMKTDMAGAATVLGALQAIADLGVPVAVRAILPFTENVISGNALRPGDVFTARNGKTVEVLNTDAEGRLILADGLSLAAEEPADLTIDVATLTGSAKVALGLEIAAAFGTDDARDLVVAAAETAGEQMWPLPLHEDYRKHLDSDIADIKNTGERWGGAISAALFLREFAGDGDWVHLDIAGPARAAKPGPYFGKGGTGFGVRTLVAVAEALADR